MRLIKISIMASLLTIPILKSDQSPLQAEINGIVYNILNNTVSDLDTNEIKKLSYKDINTSYKFKEDKENGITPLIAATQMADKELVSLILQQGADPNFNPQIQANSWPALMYLITPLNNAKTEREITYIIDIFENLVAYGALFEEDGAYNFITEIDKINDTSVRDIIKSKISFAQLFQKIKDGTFTNDMLQKLPPDIILNAFIPFNTNLARYPAKAAIDRVTLLSFALYILRDNIATNDETWNKFYTIFKTLIDNPKISINSENSTEKTPLLIWILGAQSLSSSSISRYKQVLDDLINKNANPNLQYKGQNILDYIKGDLNIQQDFKDILFKTLQNSAFFINVAITAIKNNKSPSSMDPATKNAIDFLDTVKGNADINTIDSTEHATLLMAAAEVGNPAIVRYLLETKKANPNITVPVQIDNKMTDQSALYFALDSIKNAANPAQDVINNYVETINLLIAYKTILELNGTSFYNIAQAIYDSGNKDRILEPFSFQQVVNQLTSNTYDLTKFNTFLNTFPANTLNSSLYYDASFGQQNPIVLANNTLLFIGLRILAKKSTNKQLISMIGKLITRAHAQGTVFNPAIDGQRKEFAIMYSSLNTDLFKAILNVMEANDIKTTNADGKNNTILQALIQSLSEKDTASITNLPTNIDTLLKSAAFNDQNKNDYINTQNPNDGNTALMMLLNSWALFQKAGQNKAFSSSLSALKNPEILTLQNKTGQTAANIARSIPDATWKGYAIKALELPSSDPIIDTFVAALKNNKNDEINSIINAQLTKANINHFSAEGWTPLMAAAFYGNLNALNQLVQKEGIDLNIMDGAKKMPALGFAIDFVDRLSDASNQVFLIYTLLDYGALPIVGTFNAINKVNNSKNVKRIYSQMIDRLQRMQAIEYMRTKNQTDFAILWKELEKGNFIDNNKINIAKSGNKPNLLEGNLLRILLYFMAQESDISPALQAQFNLLIEKERFLTNYDEATGKTILSFGLFSFERFKQLTQKISPLLSKTKLIGHFDKENNSLLTDILASAPSFLLDAIRKQLVSILSNPQEDLKPLINKANNMGITPLQKLFEPTRFEQFKSEVEQTSFINTLGYLYGQGLVVDSATKAFIIKLPVSDFRTRILHALGIADQPIEPTTPDEIKAMLGTFYTNLANLYNALPKR